MTAREPVSYVVHRDGDHISRGEIVIKKGELPEVEGLRLQLQEFGRRLEEVERKLEAACEAITDLEDKL